MISLPVLLGFIAATAALIIIPGPNVAVIVATGARHGSGAALTVVAGTTLAQAAQIALVVLGMTALIETYSWAFSVIKWAGIAYLAWLGLSALRAQATPSTAEPMGGRLFLRGAATALANPKTMVFHAAYLPLFTDPASPAGPQLLLLAFVFLVVAFILDSGYALASGSLKSAFGHARWQTLIHRLSGGVMLSAAGWLALRRET